MITDKEKYEKEIKLLKDIIINSNSVIEELKKTILKLNHSKQNKNIILDYKFIDELLNRFKENSELTKETNIFANGLKLTIQRRT